MRRLHVGLDLDNTIIDYDGVFASAARDMGLLPNSHALVSKAAIKSALVAADASEDAWMRLQGQVYGKYIEHAVLYEGVTEFLEMARKRNVHISIVSHKTRFGHFDPQRVGLWEAARHWLEQRRFFAHDGFALAPENVHFEETRSAKLARITDIGCDIFIDDLIEVLEDKAFPRKTRPIWFARSSQTSSAIGLRPYRTWYEIMDTVFGRS